MDNLEGSFLKFAEDTLVGVFAKLARVNLDTGEFRFVYRADGFEDDAHADSPDIYTYIRRQVEDGTVYPDHATEYLRYSDPEYVRKQLATGDRRAVINYRRKVGDSFKWMTFSVMAPASFSPENPYVLFSWREADSSTTTMYDAISVLSVFYYKILRINLTTDRYEILKADDIKNPPETISGWFKKFAEEGYVHEDDIPAYLDFTDIERLREDFRANPTRRSVRYRRRQGDGYRWAQMYLFPSVEYTSDNMVLTLYVRDVHDEHVSELRSREKLYELYSRDALTLLYNRLKYQKDLILATKSSAERMTVAYIDLNGLHEVNNLLGHDAGDNMLCTVADALKKYFPDDPCYRIGGDEFVVVSYRLSPSTVERIMDDIRRDLLVDKYEIAVGVAAGSPEDNERIVGEADLKMREDKARYYERHGDRRKRNQMNDELEKILSQKKDEEYFLKLISRRFAGVYFVDMDNGGVRTIYVPKYFSALLEQSDYNYRLAMSHYMQRYIMPEYYDRFEAVLDFKKLSKMLEKSGVAGFEYKKVDGADMQLHILSHDDAPLDQNVSVWIFEEGARRDFSKDFTAPGSAENVGWK